MTPYDDYSGPVRLKGRPGARVLWGKRDKATARAVLDNVQQVTPPLVIPWQPHQEKIERCLRHNRAEAYTLNDLFNLVDRIAPELSERMSTTDMEAWFHRTLAIHVPKRKQGYIMGAFRSVLKVVEGKRP